LIVVLAGPTGSGKTSLAVELARRVGGEIVNADSQQLYRHLDVGTAKPTAAERASVPHHLLDLVEPGEGMDAARFVALADQAIVAIAARGRLPLVVGGTGLYLRALLHGVVEAPGRDPALRSRLTAEAEALGRPALHARLALVDPEAAARIRPNDLVRVVRALEIAAGGQTQTALHAAHAFRPQRHRALFLALDPPRQALRARLEPRASRRCSPPACWRRRAGCWTGSAGRRLPGSPSATPRRWRWRGGTWGWPRRSGACRPSTVSTRVAR
jgi:tRNA dimethylallyltransferase